MCTMLISLLNIKNVIPLEYSSSQSFLFHEQMANAQYSTDENKWQTTRTLVQCNDYMFSHQVACDVHFRVHDSEGQIEDVGAHKYVLISRSSVFHAMLCGRLSSSEVNIVDISVDVFRKFIRYVWNLQL